MTSRDRHGSGGELSNTISAAKIEAESTTKTFHIITIFNFLLTILLWLIEAQVTL